MSEYFEHIYIQIAELLYGFIFSSEPFYIRLFFIQFRYTFRAFERMFESFKRESLGLIMCVIGAAGDVSNCYDITDFTESKKREHIKNA